MIFPSEVTKIASVSGRLLIKAHPFSEPKRKHRVERASPSREVLLIIVT